MGHVLIFLKNIQKHILLMF